MKADSTPATKADIDRLDASICKLAAAIRKLDTRIDQRESKFDRQMQFLLDRTNQILDTVVAIDKRLSGQAFNHDNRITKLESEMGIAV